MSAPTYAELATKLQEVSAFLNNLQPIMSMNARNLQDISNSLTGDNQEDVYGIGSTLELIGERTVVIAESIPFLYELKDSPLFTQEAAQ